MHTQVVCNQTNCCDVPADRLVIHAAFFFPLNNVCVLSACDNLYTYPLQRWNVQHWHPFQTGPVYVIIGTLAVSFDFRGQSTIIM